MKKEQNAGLVLGIGIIMTAIIVAIAFVKNVVIPMNSSGGVDPESVNNVATTRSDNYPTPVGASNNQVTNGEVRKGGCSPGPAAAASIKLEAIADGIVVGWIDAPVSLFYAISKVEDDDGKVGPAGERGEYRIRDVYWQDACEYGRVDWDYYTLVYSKEHCEQIMEWYWARYGALANEEKARIHNGGPRGMQKESTERYWLLVKEHLEKEKQ